MIVGFMPKRTCIGDTTASYRNRKISWIFTHCKHAMWKLGPACMPTGNPALSRGGKSHFHENRRQLWWDCAMKCLWLIRNVYEKHGVMDIGDWQENRFRISTIIFGCSMLLFFNHPRIRFVFASVSSRWKRNSVVYLQFDINSFLGGYFCTEGVPDVIGQGILAGM